MKRTGPKPKAEIDLHLAVAEAIMGERPVRWSHQEIAEFCGCSRRLVDLVEKEAFRKLRRILLSYPEISDVFACPLQPKRVLSTRIRTTQPR